MPIYLDNAATSYPKPESVYQALDAFARTNLANPGRSGHKMARAAEHALKDCRHLLNQFFHGKEPERFAFTLNCTDALNMAFKGVLDEGDHVVTSDLEHNSVSRPLRAMEKNGRISLTRIRADADGYLNPDDVRRAITPRTRLIALTHASNVLGTVQPIEQFGRISKEHNLLFLVDAAQTAGVVPIDVQEMNIDLLAFPGHKSLLGPTGTGALYVAPHVTTRAWREGGTGGDSTSETQPSDFPHFLEGGTPNVLGVAGLAAGIRYVQEQGMERLRTHENELIERLRGRLEAVKGVKVFGGRDSSRRVGALSFQTEQYSAQDLGNILDETFDIAVRPGLHCSPYIHRALGTYVEKTDRDGTVRVSTGPFNTVEDVDALATALAEILG